MRPARCRLDRTSPSLWRSPWPPRSSSASRAVGAPRRRGSRHGGRPHRGSPPDLSLKINRAAEGGTPLPGELRRGRKGGANFLFVRGFVQVDGRYWGSFEPAFAVLILFSGRPVWAAEGGQKTGFGHPAPARIVSLTPTVTETLFALGLGARVVGVSRYCDYPPDALHLPRGGQLSRARRRSRCRPRAGFDLDLAEPPAIRSRWRR